MIIRIVTENHRLLDSIVSRYFDGYTILYGRGYWKGQAESSVVIEIDSIGADYNIMARIRSIVSDIKALCKQESVLVQKIQCSSELC